jgi:carbon-monoxide dehydrogenase medium subunit
VKPPVLGYLRAGSPEHAVSLLVDHGEDAKLVAGGQSLVPMLNLRLARPSVLVDIAGIPDLSGIDLRPDGLAVGALTTHHAMERMPAGDLPAVAALKDAAGLIGHYPIRVRGTVGGSLAHADSTSEWALMALATDAVLTVRGPSGTRDVPAESFFRGLFTTALEVDEMLVGVRFGRLSAATRLEEYARRQGDFAIVAAATSVVVDRSTVTSARIALGGVAGQPVRVPGAERVLIGARVDTPHGLDELIAETAHAASHEVDPGSDGHGSTLYRRRLVATLVGRSLARGLQAPEFVRVAGGRP